MKVVVSRRRWVRGDIGGTSSLLNQQNRMCCLGFACRQLGLEPKHIRGHGEPMNAEWPKGAKSNPLVRFGWHSENTLLTDEAMEINDDVQISEEDREKGLKSLFRRYGHQISFIP